MRKLEAGKLVKAAEERELLRSLEEKSVHRKFAGHLMIVPPLKRIQRNPTVGNKRTVKRSIMMKP